MTRRTIEIAAFCVALLVATMAVRAWLASRDEQQRLASTLAAQKQLLDAADTRERTRQSALDDTLAQIENLKRATQSPAEILRDLPKYLSLPQPITLAPAASLGVAPAKQGIGASAKGAVPPEPRAAEEPRDLPGPAEGSANTVPPSRAPSTHDLPSAPPAQIPSADLKPLYDYVQDCRACQVELAAARQNATDDAAKIAALTQERDAAVTAAKGGTLWRRLRRDAEWFAVGAAVGASAYKLSRR